MNIEVLLVMTWSKVQRKKNCDDNLLNWNLIETVYIFNDIAVSCYFSLVNDSKFAEDIFRFKGNWFSFSFSVLRNVAGDKTLCCFYASYFGNNLENSIECEDGWPKSIIAMLIIWNFALFISKPSNEVVFMDFSRNRKWDWMKSL